MWLIVSEQLDVRKAWAGRLGHEEEWAKLTPGRGAQQSVTWSPLKSEEWGAWAVSPRTGLCNRGGCWKGTEVWVGVWRWDALDLREGCLLFWDSLFRHGRNFGFGSLGRQRLTGLSFPRCYPLHTLPCLGWVLAGDPRCACAVRCTESERRGRALCSCDRVSGYLFSE